MPIFRLYAQKIIERTYEIEAKSNSDALDKWNADRFMEPTSEEPLKGEDCIRVARVKADGSESEA